MTLAALGCALLGAAPALAQEPTKRDLSFDVVTGPQDQARCRIAARLHLPAGASAKDPVPAILGTNGFGGSRDEFDMIGPAYARRGYAFLAYSGLGFGGSGCQITLDDPDWDGKAGSQLVSWLGRQDEIVRDGPGDPRVGMLGGSYGGQIQFAIAGIDRRVDALVPQITWNDLDYALTGNNTDFERGVSSRTPGVAKLDWPLLFFGLGAGQGLAATLAEGDPTHLGACPNFAPEVCPALVNSAARGYPDPAARAFLRHASVATYVERIRVPTFLVQGLHDTLFDVQEAVATWQALRAQNTPVKMLWRSAGHSGGRIPGENDPAEPERAYESRMALEWFDWYLRGIGDPPQLDVSFLRDHVPTSGDAAPAVGSTRSYPVGAERTFALGSPELPGGGTFAALPAPTGSGGGSLAPVQIDDAPGTSVAWTTPPLDQDLDVGGVPALTVRLDAPAHAAAQAADPATKLVLFARVVDVAPDGGTSVPGDIVSAVRVPDVTAPVRIELPGIVHRFAAGHRLQVVLAQGNALRRGNLVPGPVTVREGTLTVPVTGRAGALGSGPSGTTPIEPVPGSPPAQRPGLGGPPAGTPAATLPANRRCVSRRRFTIRLRRGLRSVRVTVDGRRVRVVRRGGRSRARIDLRGLPRGTVRVMVTGRTRTGRTVRSARTYRTCTSRKARS
jgi:ABC-2 type transport system ATP-binding protein